MKQTKKIINKNMKTKTKKTKTKTKTNVTRKKLSRFIFPIKKIDHMICKEDAKELKNQLVQFFEEEIKNKIRNCPRPIKPKFGDFLERKKGRFEITPPPLLEKKIWKILLKNQKFIKINKEINDFIIKNDKTGSTCIQELCILPVEPGTTNGKWHRDIFVRSRNDFEREPFYMTQLIYLDDKSDTEFCVDSQNNYHNNPYLYVKKTYRAKPFSSVIFDGRTLHKGLSNDTKETRYAIYISYYISTYVDKDTIKENVLHKKSIC